MSSSEIWNLLSKSKENFLDPLDDEFFCMQCKIILLNPKLSNCGHHFCDQCLTQIKNINKGICPLDSEVIENSFINKNLKNKLSKLQVKCPGFAYGCKLTGSLENVEKHFYQECQQQLISCDLICGRFLTKELLEEHKRNECGERSINCEYCKQQMKAKDLAMHHDSFCLQIYINCPNGCIYDGINNRLSSNNNDMDENKKVGKNAFNQHENIDNDLSLNTRNKNKISERERNEEVICKIGEMYRFRREDLNAHLRYCPLEKIECPIESCKELLQRCQMEEHLKNNISSHFIVLNEKNLESKKNFEYIKSDFISSINVQLDKIMQENYYYFPMIKSINEQNEKLSYDIMQIKSINEISSMNISKINGSLTTLRSDNNNLKAELEKQKTEKDFLKQEITKLKTESGLFKSENENLNKNIKNLFEKIGDLSKENIEMNKKIIQVETVLNPLPAQFLVWKLQMSSVYKNASVTSYEQLTSDDITQGGVTKNSTCQFIKCIFPNIVLFKKITLAQYCGLSKGTNGSYLQYSTDDVNYVNLFEVSGVTDEPKSFEVEPFLAKYIRLYKSSGYVSAGIMRFE